MVPFFDHREGGTKAFEPKMKDLFVESEANDAAELDVHHGVSGIVSMIYRLNRSAKFKFKFTLLLGEAYGLWA